MAVVKDPSGGADLTDTEHPANPSGTAASAGNGSADGLALRTSAQLLGLTAQYPVAGVCVVAVDGELDMLTASLLDACIREQLAAAPTHLILDLQPVRFLGSSGLHCLLQARELAQQIPGTQLHLTGLVNRAVVRPLKVAALLELFDTYPSLTDALAALAPE